MKIQRPDDVPAVCTLFEGTRADSSLTGSISGLTTHNFTPLHLIYGVMDGMADELHRMYTAYRQAGGTPKRLSARATVCGRTGICSSALSLPSAVRSRCPTAARKLPQARRSSPQSSRFDSKKAIEKSYHQYSQIFRALARIK